jgi:hypothetical protein
MGYPAFYRGKTCHFGIYVLVYVLVLLTSSAPPAFRPPTSRHTWLEFCLFLSSLVSSPGLDETAPGLVCQAGSGALAAWPVDSVETVRVAH